MKVLFVCTGNTCRSPMAEGILKDLAEDKGLDLEVSSAGISTFNGGGPAKNSMVAMEGLGINIEGHRTLQVNQDILDKHDLVLTMSQSHKENILYEYNVDEDKVFTLLEYIGSEKRDIADPFGGTIEIYKYTRDEIYKAIEKLLEVIG